jgi:hypothetical protein
MRCDPSCVSSFCLAVSTLLNNGIFFDARLWIKEVEN